MKKKNKKSIKPVNPVAKARSTGMHGPAPTSQVHGSLKYSRKVKHKGNDRRSV